ncbi:MAG TPA: LuxR C-terminal-related transcriptional regulator, partial [Streptosporangiaceae bacterium]|nr:LuxR C-terminal-related transcriptional regulator [Streptosporangiaceae bacterium]
MTLESTVSDGIAIGVESRQLNSKVRIPCVGDDVFRRDRLTELIERATARPVTMLAAPAGSGKTVACAVWAAEKARSRRVAWLSLDEGDREPARFWASMTAALATGGTSAVSELVPRSRDGDDDLPADLVLAMRRLSGSVVLVLDDVHVLAGSDVMPGLALLAHNAPASLRLILSGRSLPELHVARMRVAGTLSEIMPADLACTAEEAEGYFAALGLAASAAERDELLSSVEGWMAGPRLAALIAARDGALSVGVIAADPIVADYLCDEVLDQQPAAIRRFLRRTSVAERLTESFADWLTGEHGGTRILDQLSRSGSFVSRDAQGKYRYHPFLRQVLLGELRGGTPEEVPGLLGRAARWHTRDGDAIEAVRCWAETGDWEHASLALTEAGLAGVLPDRIAELEAALGLFPVARRGADPAVAAALGMARLCRGDPASADAYLALAAAGLDDRVPNRLVVELWLAMLRTARQPDALAACWALAERAQVRASKQAEHQALGLLWLALGTALLRRWEITAARRALASARHQLTAAGAIAMRERTQGWMAVTEVLYGDLQGAAGIIERLRSRVPPDPAAVFFAAIAAAHLAVEQDDLVAAARLLDEADPGAVSWLPGEPDAESLLMLARVRAAIAEGDVAAARDMVRLVCDKYGTDEPVPCAVEADIALLAGDPRLTTAALGQSANDRVAGAGACRTVRADQLAARARLLLALGDPAGALEAARQCASDGELTLRDRITALVAATLASRRLGADREAARSLEQALGLAEPHRAYRPFLDMGGDVHSAIAILVAPASPAAGFAARVREHLISRPLAKPPDAAPGGRETPALTASELAVLRLLRSHLTNQEIADALYLSVNTVKTHLRAVYHKLG